MAPETDPTEITTPAETTSVEVTAADKAALARTSSAQASSQAAIARVRQFLANIFVYVKEFFAEYQSELKNVALLLAGLIILYFLIAILDAIHDLPLLAPFFELVGVGYTAWFVVRYWKASHRQKLWQQVRDTVDEILGDRTKTKA